jgi:hypothetical protein
VKPVTCPECQRQYVDIGSFMNHMYEEHGWLSIQSLMYWSQHWGIEEDAEEEDKDL